MKILLLSNCNNSNPSKLDDCITKTELMIYLIKQHIQEIPDIKLITSKCYPTLSNSKLNCYPLVDHIIFINPTGFYNIKNKFYNQIKNNSKYTISTICDNIKFSTYEDITFTIDQCTYHNKLAHMVPPLDTLIYAPRQENNILCVLLSRPPIMMDLYNTDIPYILEKFIKTKFNVPVKIGLIDQKSVDWIDADGNISETTNFELYIDFVYEISKANIFFLTHKSLDKFLLYELSMCNTLIVSKDINIEHHLTKELSIYAYDEEFKLADILDTAIIHDIRPSLMETSSWNCTLMCIINKLQEMETKTQTKDLIIPSQIQTINRNLNINNKNKPHITKILTQAQLPEIKKPKKLPVFLQSQIRK